MTTTVARLQNPVPIEEPQGYESDKADFNNANVNSNHEGKQGDKAESPSAHTDNENDAKGEATARSSKIAICNRVTVISSNSKESVHSLKDVSGNGNEEVKVEECIENTKLQENFNHSSPHLDRSAAASRGASNRRKKLASFAHYHFSSSEDEFYDTDQRLKSHKSDKEESYAKIKMRRKTLLKIEKLTDSDSRSRDEMRSRGLSPPSSSDEENLYIGWVAYPSNWSKSRIHSANSHNRQRALCTCIDALKCIMSPVTKVCKFCRRNKVYDVESLKEKLIEESADSDARPESKKTI